jgi:DNA-binding transcriptional regulator YiaG
MSDTEELDRGYRQLLSIPKDIGANEILAIVRTEKTLTASGFTATLLRMEMTQSEFGCHIGVALATVNRWERGWAYPTHLAERLLLQVESSSKGSKK